MLCGWCSVGTLWLEFKDQIQWLSMTFQAQTLQIGIVWDADQRNNTNNSKLQFVFLHKTNSGTFTDQWLFWKTHLIVSFAPGNLQFNILNIDDLSTPRNSCLQFFNSLCIIPYKCIETASKTVLPLTAKAAFFSPNQTDFFFLRLHLHKYILSSQPVFLLPRRCPL